MSSCPCGGESYESCCQPRHTGEKPAQTAEQLMRARYSAFAKAEVGFLLATGTHDSAPTLREWAQSVTWLGLQVLEHEAGGAADEAGTVRFVARYVESGKLIELAERSQFGKVAGQWRYLDGEPNVSTRELERNEPCPCGSGRKFKKCHA